MEALKLNVESGQSLSIITYGRGVYWAKESTDNFKGKIEIIDLRTLYPLDEDLVFSSVRKHGKCLVITEEPSLNSFAQSLAARISENCFQFLDAPVMVIGSENLPAIPLNENLEEAMIPNKNKVCDKIRDLLNY